jgi:osmotically-inducible protein OsmY
MADKKKRPKNPLNNPEQDWNQRMKRRGEDVYGEGDDYVGEGYRERNQRSSPPSHSRNADRRVNMRVDYNDQEQQETSNYGRGGYYGNTYDPDGYLRDRDRGRSDWRESSRWDRDMGDQRWQSQQSLRPGYRSNEDRLRESGMHRGKGPKGYQRSDERILEDINDRLADDPFIDASDIEVQNTNGDITLTGTVENRDAKRRAEDIADRVTGVKNVENRLRVKQNTDWRNRDGNTESRAKESKRGAINQEMQ